MNAAIVVNSGSFIIGMKSTSSVKSIHVRFPLIAFIVSGVEEMGFEHEDEIIVRRAAGATHSFRLTPGAYSIIEGVPKKSKLHSGRSAWVSSAIIFYATSPTVNVVASMGSMVYPNMPVASPEKLHEECIKLAARCEWWVTKYNEERDAHERLKNRSFITRMLKLFRK